MKNNNQVKYLERENSSKKSISKHNDSTSNSINENISKISNKITSHEDTYNYKSNLPQQSINDHPPQYDKEESNSQQINYNQNSYLEEIHPKIREPIFKNEFNNDHQTNEQIEKVKKKIKKQRKLMGKKYSFIKSYRKDIRDRLDRKIIQGDLSHFIKDTREDRIFVVNNRFEDSNEDDEDENVENKSFQEVENAISVDEEEIEENTNLLETPIGKEDYYNKMAMDDEFRQSQLNLIESHKQKHINPEMNSFNKDKIFDGISKIKKTHSTFY